MFSVKDAILISVLYADIFDYSFTLEEMRTWLVFYKNNQLSQKSFSHIDVISREHAHYFVLPKRHSLIAIRKKRFKYSKEKWKSALRVSQILQILPSVQLVGVTGALAMNNAKKNDDIDFFIIVYPETLWVSRLFVTILVELFGRRRRPNELNPANKVCLNMYVTRSALAVPTKERDLFTAHEVLQMVPLWDRHNTYQKFLKANKWVKTFLPNAWRQKFQASSTKPGIPFGYLYLIIRYCLEFVIWLLRFAEVPARVMQLWYMRKRRSTEIVTDNVIRFHPRDARNWIYDALGKRLKRYNIPLDKIFYAS